MIEAVVSRLEAQVPDLSGRVQGAAEFAALMRDGRLPPHAPAAYVLPLGLSGGAADAGAGAFTQMVAETVGVVLFFDAHDRTGARALARLQPFRDEVIAALCGWAPEGALGVFQFSRGALLSIARGRLAYQLDFQVNDQLRILP